MSEATARYLPHLAYILPSFIAALYALRSLPLHSNELPAAIDPGLTDLPVDSRVRVLYPEDWTSGGGYATLPMGRVRYWIVGPKEGKKVVLVHGLNTPAIVFSRIVPILVAGGFHVLVYDLYGRGYSDAPQNAPYDANLYVTQLALLLQYVRWERTRVLGFSMGGAIAAAFVATFPHLVEKDVVLMASAGALEVQIPFFLFAILQQLPQGPVPFSGYRQYAFVQNRILKRFLGTMPIKTSAVDEKPQISEIIPLQATHLPGYRRAVASSLLEGPIVRMHWAFKSNNWAGKRVLFIHGTVDRTVPPAHSLKLRDWLESGAKPETRVVDVLGAGHDLTLTHSTLVGAALTEFFGGED
ncbi:Hydrolase-4 domain-containing protein [Mycena indigotica]|uniref:Hydrolase-4 domain-containing protein n=1 Tax=Mycena indigotica TaxID=2126181 RepID=A0A8H6S1G4_9AGAR|nr:Hydrolase-4 domain-containing protein [Mycena indigotica]KAF7290692.1 Hydrolase-4 domain-containing protein [Mycena indigotica]